MHLFMPLATRMISLMIIFLARTADAFVVGSLNPHAALTSRTAPPPSMFFDEASGFLGDAVERLDRLEQGLLNETQNQVKPDGIRLLERMQPTVRASDSPFVVQEDEDTYTITFRSFAHLPSEVSITVEGNMLKVSGTTERYDKDRRAHVCSSFSRSMSLPSDADSEVLSTTYEAGQVTVVLPKFSEASAPVVALPAELTTPEADSDKTLQEAQGEAERLAAESPRFRRWLKAHGYLAK